MAKRTTTKKQAPKRRRVRADSVPPGPSDDFWYNPIGGYSGSIGADVTPDSAQRVNAVYACVRVLSNTLASLPLKVYRMLPSGGKAPAPEHPLWPVLYGAPNRWQTSFEWRKLLMNHLCLRGVAYCEILAGDRGAVSELIPLHPDRVKPERLMNGRLRFRVTGEDGIDRYLTQDEVFRVLLDSTDGITPLSPIALNRTTIGLTQSLETHGAALFENGATLKVALETDKKLNKEAIQQMRDGWHAKHGGPRNAGTTAILADGLKVHELGLNNEDAQYLETRQFQIADIARIFGVPPHLIQDLTRSTNNNIEHQGIEFTVHTMRPWFVMWEQAIGRDLVVDEGVFAKFLVDALLRGDAVTRSTALQTRFQNGNLSINEWREIEDQNPVEDGDRYFVQRNLIPVDKIDEELAIQQQKLASPSPRPAGPTDDSSPPSDSAARQAFDVLIADAAERLANAEIAELEKRADKADEDRDRFTLWVEQFYGGTHWRYAVRMLTPIFNAFSLKTEAMYVASEILKDAQNVFSGVDPSAVLTAWKTTRASAVEAIIRKAIDHERAAAA